MQAIIELGGKQYRVSKDTVFFAELTGVAPGNELTIKNVLLVSDNGRVRVGQPFVAGATVVAKVLEEVKGPKLFGLFYRPKKHSQRRWGHRQRYHKLQVTAIQA
ncbi:MAG: 50S ribosomal protein L21 [Turneriella sp.]|nr:50S ribosomal protein L21 [Turneriella sp.]